MQILNYNKGTEKSKEREELENERIKEKERN